MPFGSPNGPTLAGPAITLQCAFVGRTYTSVWDVGRAWPVLRVTAPLVCAGYVSSSPNGPKRPGKRHDQDRCPRGSGLRFGRQCRRRRIEHASAITCCGPLASAGPEARVAAPRSALLYPLVLGRVQRMSVPGDGRASFGEAAAGGSGTMRPFR